MKTAEEIVQEFNKGIDRIKETNPGAPAAKMKRLDIRAVKAALHIHRCMLNYPIQNLAGEDFSHPSKWDERTILLMTGTIMSFYQDASEE